MYRKITALVVLLCIAIGCAHRVEINQLPTGSEDFLPSEVSILIPAVVKFSALRVNGMEIEPDAEFLDLVLQKVQRTHVFLEVSAPEESGNLPMRKKAVRLSLSVNGIMEINQATNWLKLAANCVTLFLFSSAIPYKDSFDVTMLLKAVRYDGEEKNYRSRIKGDAYYSMFGGEAARKAAREEVVTKLLNSLMRQVMSDIAFFAMEES
jgi:hypothetical protein